MKTCNKCNVTKALLEYDKDIRNKDGLQGICHVCRMMAKKAVAAKRAASGTPVSVTHKTCNKCDITKESMFFYKDSGISDGLATTCKDCRDESMARWRDNNRKDYNANMKTWRAENKAAAKSADLKRCYGISLEIYNEMLVAQNGVCSICKKPPKGKRPLVVDHCHNSEKVRGLLCYGCNRLIVALDSHPLHDSMVAYLTKHKAA